MPASEKSIGPSDCKNGRVAAGKLRLELAEETIPLRGRVVEETVALDAW